MPEGTEEVTGRSTGGVTVVGENGESQFCKEGVPVAGSLEGWTVLACGGRCGQCKRAG